MYNLENIVSLILLLFLFGTQPAYGFAHQWNRGTIMKEIHNT